MMYTHVMLMRGYVMRYDYIYIYIQSDVVEYRPGISAGIR